jgi:hypothetical protein
MDSCGLKERVYILLQYEILYNIFWSTMLDIWPKFPYTVKKLTSVPFHQVYFNLDVDVEKLVSPDF